MGWYGGVPLLEHLETVDIAADRDRDHLRFPVQWVIRDPATDYRGYAGQLAGGELRPGDEVVVLPAGTHDDGRGRGDAGRAAARRRSRRCPSRCAWPTSSTCRAATCCAPRQPRRAWPASSRPTSAGWRMPHCGRAAATRSSTRPRRPGRSSTRSCQRVDVATYSTDPSAHELGLNDIGRVRLRTSRPLAHDAYAENRTTGSFILIDEATNDTVGAGMIA